MRKPWAWLPSPGCLRHTPRCGRLRSSSVRTCPCYEDALTAYWLHGVSTTTELPSKNPRGAFEWARCPATKYESCLPSLRRMALGGLAHVLLSLDEGCSSQLRLEDSCGDDAVCRSRAERSRSLERSGVRSCGAEVECCIRRGPSLGKASPDGASSLPASRDCRKRHRIFLGSVASHAVASSILLPFERCAVGEERRCGARPASRRRLRNPALSGSAAALSERERRTTCASACLSLCAVRASASRRSSRVSTLATRSATRMPARLAEGEKGEERGRERGRESGKVGLAAPTPQRPRGEGLIYFCLSHYNVQIHPALRPARVHTAYRRKGQDNTKKFLMIYGRARGVRQEYLSLADTTDTHPPHSPSPR
eukprot:scaffold171727_cov40-Tisochrysis_lutea.AAC.2